MSNNRRYISGLGRAKPTKSPLIYIATIAQAKGSPRFHVHALLWEYVHAPVLHGQCRDLGLGHPCLDHLVFRYPGDLNYWTQTTYVLTQHKPAFGTTTHERHEPLPPFARPFLIPQSRTLRQHCPRLFAALQLAKDPTVSDETLFKMLPKVRITNRESMDMVSTVTEDLAVSA